MARNAHKSTFVRGSLPNIFEGEDRRFQQCEQPFIVLASVEDGSMYKNDVTHVFQNVVLGSDTVTITIEKNGVELANRGTSVFYPNSPNAVGFIFDWRQYLQNEGAGCYTIKLACILAGVQVDFAWGNYELSPWTIDSAMNTVRVYSRFNSYALNHNIDFTGSNAVDSIRFEGFFGNMQPNTKVNNLRGNNNVQSKVTRENLKTYELTSDLLNVCHTKRLIDLHFLHENTIWISDHNPQNHSYDYRDIELIVKEVPEVEYKKDVRGAVVSCVFEDKQPYYKSRYRTSSPLGDVTPAPTCQDATVENSDATYSDTVASGGTLVLPDTTINITDQLGNPLDTITFPVYTPVNIDIDSYCPPAVTRSTATLMKTGQTTSYRTGDDGDLQAGRATDFLTLDAAPVHNDGSATINTTTNRFTDINGLQVYGDNIVLDWSTWNGSTLLGYHRRLLSSGGVFDFNWNDAIDLAAAYSNGIFTTGWRLWNRNEINNIVNTETLSGFTYAPFNNPAGELEGRNLWSSSTLKINTTQAWFTQFYGRVDFNPKTNTKRVIAVRTFSLSTSNILS